MERSLIDRWTDTTVFSCLLIVSWVAVFPVLAAGVLITVFVGAELLMQGSDVGIAQAVFAFLSIGGVLGFVGYVRARVAARKPERHNLTATFICLAVGVATALAVGGFALIPVVYAWTDPWRERLWVIAPALFAVANLVWAMSGVAWIQRLMRCYAEKTGRCYDSVPVMLLSVAMTLATTTAVFTFMLGQGAAP